MTASLQFPATFSNRNPNPQQVQDVRTSIRSNYMECGKITLWSVYVRKRATPKILKMVESPLSNMDRPTAVATVRARRSHHKIERDSPSRVLIATEVSRPLVYVVNEGMAAKVAW